MSDDDLEEYLDPELDPTPGRSGLPGPLTLPRLAAGVHVLAGIGLLPFVWLAYRAGDTGRATSLALLIGLLFAAGAVMKRVTARKYGEE